MYKDIMIDVKVKETHKYCDVCGAEIHNSLACSVAECECCGKDLCDKCVGHEGFSCGDYRVVYCQKCWDIGEDFRDEIKILEIKVEQLYEEWKQRCNCSR